MKKLVSIQTPGRMTVLAALLSTMMLPAIAATKSPVVISQVYGGGGNSGAVYKTDFIELYNRSKDPVEMVNWSVQYGSATGLTAWQGTTFSGTIPGRSYFLVQEAAGANGTIDLTNVAVVGTLNMSGTTGKVALVNNTSLLTGAAVSGANVLDVIGYGPTANGFEGRATALLTNITAAIRNDSGCTDTDNNAADFTLAAPSPKGTGTVGTCVVPFNEFIATFCPAGVSLAPGGGSIPLAASDSDGIVNAAIVTSTAVPGISLTGFTAATTNAERASASLTIDPSVGAGIYPITVKFSNNQAQEASCKVDITVQGLVPLTNTIPAIQGSGATSPLVGTVQTTEGVITKKFATGYFIQDLNGDNDVATSDGILVFGATTDAVVGDLVRVTGTVTEYKPNLNGPSYTELTGVGAGAVKISGGHTIAPTTVDFPRYDLSRYQGMLVRFGDPLVINQTTSLTGFGEVMLASKRREVPTNLYRAGSPEAIALAAANAADQIVLMSPTGATPTATTLPYFDYSDKTLRVGDSFGDLVGVVDFGSIGNGAVGYKLQPLSTPTLIRSNARTAEPTVATGNLRVASANVLNFFITFTDGTDYTGASGKGCFAGAVSAPGNCRGANNLTEFVRQRDKIVNELAALNADVVGLMEIENNKDAAVSYLVDQLNAKVGLGTYAYVGNAPATGTDAIRVAMIYKPSAVSMVGTPQSDADPVNNRPPLAQTFKATNGAKFSVIVNHLKSKAGCPGPNDSDYAGNFDSGDGQSCFNATRRLQAQRLVNTFVPAVAKLAGDDDVLLIGDFNSHGHEDPIIDLTTAAKGALVNELERQARPRGLVYSYVFDGLAGYLDHALATASLDAQVVDATEWHNNADEPVFIDYNTEGKFSSLYVNNAYRASDHDPVVVSLNLTPTFSNVSTSFAVQRGALSVGRTATTTGTVTITNTSAVAISGPLQFELTGLPSTITLTNASGVRNGVPYITVNAASIAPGASATISLVFNNPAKGAIPYTPVISSGTF